MSGFVCNKQQLELAKFTFLTLFCSQTALRLWWNQRTLFRKHKRYIGTNAITDIRRTTLSQAWPRVKDFSTRKKAKENYRDTIKEKNSDTTWIHGCLFRCQVRLLYIMEKYCNQNYTRSMQNEWPLCSISFWLWLILETWQKTSGDQQQTATQINLLFKKKNSIQNFKIFI